jgi:very-short-patch-repair endonuclease
MNSHPADVRRAVATWLATHHGVIARHEAVELGLTPAEIKRLLRTGEWERLYPGVYRLSAAPAGAGFGLVYAAVLAAGEGAAASHLSAAWLWHLQDGGPPRPTVTVPHDRRPRVAGVRIIRSRHLLHPVRRYGIPTTSVVRTVVDCAGELAPDATDALIDTAVAQKAISVDALIKAICQPELRQYPGRLLVAQHLERRGISGSPHPSALESRMARLLRRHRLPVPKAEVEWGPDRQYRLDFAYPTLRLAIEVDGWAGHLTPEKQRRDHRRQRRLTMAGWTVLHFDWWEVTHEPERVAGEIAAAYRALAA